MRRGRMKEGVGKGRGEERREEKEEEEGGMS